MIQVNRPAGPQQLLHPPASEVAFERSEATKFYTAAVRAKEPFKFKIYRKDYIKNAIETIFNQKCAYCETRYVVSSPVDVEHFRPKSLVKVDKEKKPGYYWLASEWTNLLPSCNLCNRSQTYLMPNNKKETMGKMNFFPLEDEAHRATKPGDEQNEKPLLLNPIDDKPENHLEFTSDGVVRPAVDSSGQQSRKGEVSIKVYGLCRPELVEERAKRAKLILAHIERVKFLAGKAKQYPKDEDFKNELRQEFRELRDCLEPSQVYVGMARQITADFFNSIANTLVH